MKRKMISVLALALIVLMSVVLVSCEDMLPVAPENVVAAVVYETDMDFGTEITIAGTVPTTSQSLLSSQLSDLSNGKRSVTFEN